MNQMYHYYVLFLFNFKTTQVNINISLVFSKKLAYDTILIAFDYQN